MTRIKAREQAFILIFEKSFHENPVSVLIENAKESREYIDDPFIDCLVNGTLAEMESLDEVIKKHLVGWKIERLSRVAVSVLRMALFEILHCEEIPDSVSINEAVELAKKYGGQEDSSYINGVLGTIVRKNEQES